MNGGKKVFSTSGAGIGMQKINLETLLFSQNEIIVSTLPQIIFRE